MPAPVTAHAVDGDAREHLPGHLDQRQRPMVTEAAVVASLVGVVVNEVDVTGRGVICVCWMALMKRTTAHSTQEPGCAAYMSGPLPVSPGAFCLEGGGAAEINPEIRARSGCDQGAISVRSG